MVSWDVCMMAANTYQAVEVWEQDKKVTGGIQKLILEAEEVKDKMKTS
jgi:hypothetical protein